jgi:hypothetical protein
LSMRQGVMCTSQHCQEAWVSRVNTLDSKLRTAWMHILHKPRCGWHLNVMYM